MTATWMDRLTEANRRFETRYPGDPADRQPIHVVYGGAQRFRADTARKFGVLALETLRTSAPDARTLTQITGVPEAVYGRVISKLEREPVEDFRIDFEDGYGSRSDSEEDEHARQAAAELVRAMSSGSLPPFIGIRIKALTNVLAARAARTLEIFIEAAIRHSGTLPPNFTVTLPKVTISEQVAALDDLLCELEHRFSLEQRSILVELMVETPQIVVDKKGVCAIPAMIEAAEGRCRGIHFGPYDYTSSLNIASPDQSLSHPACEFARQLMIASAAATGVTVSDGPTKRLPLPVHRGAEVTEEQREENKTAVYRGMTAHCADIRRALRDGIYQGWDLHPAQLPTRYAATYAFFLEGLDEAVTRLRNFLNDAQQVTLSGNLFDDAASGQGLLNFFLRGYSCGALDEADVARTGLTMDDVRERSFMRILERRRASVSNHG